jgi:hypothetical protein
MRLGINHGLKLLAVAVLTVTAAWGHCWAQAVNLDAAKKEGKVVVYGAQVPQAMKPLHAAFEKKYGITVDYWRGSSTGVSERALTEWRAGKPGFDVVEGNRGVQLIMRDEGLFSEIRPAVLGEVPRPVQGKGRHDHALARLADQHSLQHRHGKAWRTPKDFRRSPSAEMDQQNHHARSHASYDHGAVSLESEQVQRRQMAGLR